MEARKLLDAAPFEVETIKVLKQALDAAWGSIAPSISVDMVDDTRLSLAHAIVAHAGTGDWDCESLKHAAVEAVQKHPPRVPSSP
jgi:hypothetical protein